MDKVYKKPLKPTRRQLRIIQQMENIGFPLFDGYTMEDARQYINKWRIKHALSKIENNTKQ